jgi:hypothetical protein
MATPADLVREIDARMRRGESFSSIEDQVIDRSGLSEDEKSALWLYGWSFVDARQRPHSSAGVRSGRSRSDPSRAWSSQSSAMPVTSGAF